MEARLERLQHELHEFARTGAGRASHAAGEQPPAPAAPLPAKQPVGTPRRVVDGLLEQPPATLDGARLRNFLTALLTVPDELREVFRDAPDQAADRVASRREALDQALFERWNAVDMEAAAGAVEALGPVDWEALARWVRQRQEEAVEALAGHDLHRFAPPAMALLSPDTAVVSDEPPVATTNPDLRDRVAEVTPGNGGWRLGQNVICRARARLYEWHEA